jgi:hypothetical protein
VPPQARNGGPEASFHGREAVFERFGFLEGGFTGDVEVEPPPPVQHRLDPDARPEVGEEGQALGPQEELRGDELSPGLRTPFYRNLSELALERAPRIGEPEHDILEPVAYRPGGEGYQKDESQGRQAEVDRDREPDDGTSVGLGQSAPDDDGEATQLFEKGFHGDGAPLIDSK